MAADPAPAVKRPAGPAKGPWWTRTRVVLTAAVLALNACGGAGESALEHDSSAQPTHVVAPTPTGVAPSSTSSVPAPRRVTASSAATSTASPASGSSAAGSSAAATTPAAATATASGGGGSGRGPASAALVAVLGVSDGDTLRVRVDGSSERVRLLGIDAPESVHPNTPRQCFGKEASSRMQSLAQSKQVRLVADRSQGDRDRYGRLLRYVELPDGTDVGLALVSGGFARERTYDGAYARQGLYRAAQASAKSANLGLWAACAGVPAAAAPSRAASSGAASSATSNRAPAPQSGSCSIKGNINSEGEKIYHLPGQRHYGQTRISPGKGERMFCSESDAVDSGWRKSKV